MAGNKEIRSRADLIVLGFGGAFALAAFISAYNATQYVASSIALGIAAAGFGLSAAICITSFVWLLRPAPTATPDANGPAAHAEGRVNP
jgi:uncharacterized membrane protein YedE/YeeE